MFHIICVVGLALKTCYMLKFLLRDVTRSYKFIIIIINIALVSSPRLKGRMIDDALNANRIASLKYPYNKMK